MHGIYTSILVLWGVQGFLALFFLSASAPKLLGRVLERRTGFSRLPRTPVVFIGATEVLGAIGLAHPMASGIAPWLTPLAQNRRRGVSRHSRVMPSEEAARSRAACGGTDGRTRQTVYWPSARPAAENPSDGTTTVIAVANPHELAARCWDGGFTVLVCGDADNPIFTIIDRLGRRLELVRLP